MLLIVVFISYSINRWLRCYATSWLISFSEPNPSNRIIPGFVQPVTEMSTGRFMGTKRGLPFPLFLIIHPQ
jgi:hypothetical protein